MLRLLPPVCRDCGKTARQARLAAYLDFELCAPCIAKREPALRAPAKPPPLHPRPRRGAKRSQRKPAWR